MDPITDRLLREVVERIKDYLEANSLGVMIGACWSVATGVVAMTPDQYTAIIAGMERGGLVCRIGDKLYPMGYTGGAL